MIHSKKGSGGLLRRGPPLALMYDCLSMEAPRVAVCQVPQTLEAMLATTLATLGVASVMPGMVPLHVEGSQQWTVASGQYAARWTGQGQQHAIGALQGGQERNSRVVVACSKAEKGCGKESVILLLLKKLGNKLLCKEGKGRKKERSGRWLLLRISITVTL